MELTILPSALMDIARTKFFYDNIEEGLGALVVWRVLDTRFDPRRIEEALSNPTI